MSLQPFFSLSPVTPRINTYDAANPNLPYAFAYVQNFGVFLTHSPNSSLEGQYNSNQALVANDPVPDTEQTISSMPNGVYRRSVVQVLAKGTNVSTVNQYLFVFRLARAWGSPIAQFFVGLNLVHVEELTQAPHDDIAMLLDVPGDNVYVSALVRLAAVGSNYSHAFLFKGVDCYLL